jgi:hypothetical protein
MLRTLLLLAVTAPLYFASVGCAPAKVPVRASNLNRMSAADAHAHVDRPVADVAHAVQAAFSARGYPVVDQRKASPSEQYLVFSGGEKDNFVLAGSSVRGTGHVDGATYRIGSWFAVRLTAVGNATDLFILGKPTIASVAVCSDADAELSDVQYSCRDTMVSNLGQLAPYFTGHAEADVARGVLVEVANSR